MENELLDYLDLLGYDGFATGDVAMSRLLQGGAKCVEYTQLVEWICAELKMILNLKNEVHATRSEKEWETFLVEMADFLQELECPHAVLFKGPLSHRLSSKKNNMLLLSYLLTELMAAQMNVFKTAKDERADIVLEESTTAANLQKLLEIFDMSKPDGPMRESLLFSKLETGLRAALKKAVPELVGRPLFTSKMTDKQWNALEEIQSELNEEYRIRREMLLKRLDVTIQSFQTSNKPESNIDEMRSMFADRRSLMTSIPNVGVEDLLAARDDLAKLEKASCASVRKNTQTSINKVIIGRVPDRGGRPSEQDVPPPEMPSWQKERAPVGGGPGGSGRGGGAGSSRGGGGGSGHGGGAGSSRGGGGGSGHGGHGGHGSHGSHGGHGGRGGRVQGNWNRGFDRGDYHGDRGYQESRGGSDNRSGGYSGNRGFEESFGGYRGRHQGGRGGRRDGGRRSHY